MKMKLKQKLNKEYVLIFGVAIIVIIFGIIFLQKSRRNLYDKAAYKAAQTFLNNEAESHTWTNVKTGNLDYNCTLYNEESDIYRVYYFAKFDVLDDPEEEYVEICVELEGNELAVLNTNCSYFDTEYYKIIKEEDYGGVQDKDGYWKNIDQLK